MEGVLISLDEDDRRAHEVIGDLDSLRHLQEVALATSSAVEIIIDHEGLSESYVESVTGS